MALQPYPLVFPQSVFDVVCNIPNPHIQHFVEPKGHDQTDSRLVIYQPTIWTHDFIAVLDENLPLTQVNLKEKVSELEKKVMALIVDFEKGSFGTLELLGLIDDIERLGLGYRFRNAIWRALDIIASTYGVDEEEDSLYEASLRFRILRQHGYNVSQGFVRRFRDSDGVFIGCLETDVKGLISLFEASHLAFLDESDLHEAKLFATKHLVKLKAQENDAHIIEHIIKALEVPLYHMMLRLQARCYIDVYKKQEDAINLHLLELATLDFNIIQVKYKTELKQVSKWWKNIGLAGKLVFVRDRLMECFFWTVGMVFEPQYHSCRVGLTKVGTLITVIDDIYDVYGTLDELEIFTDAVKRWDINAMEHMPKCLQLGFRVLYNLIIEMGSNTSIAQREDITPTLVKVWGELLEAFLVEAKWTRDKYIPTLEDYLDNAWISVSGVVILTHGYFLINQEVVGSLERYHDLIKWSSMIFRLYNDLATSPNEVERGETVNAISCYMHENDVCEEVARAYVVTLIDEAWMKLIKVNVTSSHELASPFIDMAINLARISRCTYQYGDGHGAPDARARDRVLSVIIEPIKIREKEHI